MDTIINGRTPCRSPAIMVNGDFGGPPIEYVLIFF